jgi:hypothetical protein
VREADRFRMVKADLTDENDTTAELMEKFQVKGVPTVILSRRAAGDASHGRLRRARRTPGGDARGEVGAAQPARAPAAA